MYDSMIDVISKRRHFQRIIPPQKVNGQKELFAEISNALNQVPGYTSCLLGEFRNIEVCCLVKVRVQKINLK